MEFNSKKFEQIIHGSTKDVSVEPYKSSSEDPNTTQNTHNAAAQLKKMKKNGAFWNKFHF